MFMVLAGKAPLVQSDFPGQSRRVHDTVLVLLESDPAFCIVGQELSLHEDFWDQLLKSPAKIVLPRLPGLFGVTAAVPTLYAIEYF